MSQQSSHNEEQPVSIKQRVIGAIVLVSLGVIFIPMLLNSERALDDGMPVFGSNIPDKPASLTKQSKPVNAPVSSAIIIKSQADFDARVPVDEHTPKLKSDSVASFAKVEKSKPTDAKPKEISKATATKATKIITAKTTPKAKQPAKAWAIQVGSFSDRNNAFKLRNKLRTNKFTAFVDAVKKSNSYVYRVRVGPEVKRAQAERLQQRIKKELKITGLVVAHP